MKNALPLAVIAFTIFLSAQVTQVYGEGSVLIVRISSEISRPTAELVARSIEEARVGGASLVVYALNTPGGELEAVTEIMSEFNNSPVPVLVWVSPPGATAWSGGTYILMSSHIAAMASGTTIGSAQPVLSTGELLNQSKYINALTGLMRDNARLHNRNETIAEQFVTQNINLGPEEAIRFHVVEFAADTLDGLFAQLERYTLILSKGELGTSVWRLVPTEEVGSHSYTRSYTFSSISTSARYTYEPGIGIRLLEFLSNPLIASVLFIVGLYSLIIGLKTPGFGLEIGGALMLFLALVGFGIIGINIAAALLFVLGILLTLIEIKTHIGLFAFAGIGMIILGSFLAFPLPGWELLSAKAIEQARMTLIAIAFTMSAIFGLIVYKVARARMMKVKVGPEQLIGRTGTALSDLAPLGEVRIEGQIWRAEALQSYVKQGERVEVVGREGLILRVKPKQARSQGD